MKYCLSPHIIYTIEEVAVVQILDPNPEKSASLFWYASHTYESASLQPKVWWEGVPAGRADYMRKCGVDVRLPHRSYDLPVMAAVWSGIIRKEDAIDYYDKETGLPFSWGEQRIEYGFQFKYGELIVYVDSNGKFDHVAIAAEDVVLGERAWTLGGDTEFSEYRRISLVNREKLLADRRKLTGDSGITMRKGCLTPAWEPLPSRPSYHDFIPKEK